MPQGILIAGGYGVAGRRIAAELASDYPEQIIVAGRDFDRAKATAVAIGHGARGREVYVTVPSSVSGAAGEVRFVELVGWFWSWGGEYHWEEGRRKHPDPELSRPSSLPTSTCAFEDWMNS